MAEHSSLPIADYALVGDRRTAALISRGGSVDWMCLPHFDSAASFAALLGTPAHGRWLLGPAGETESSTRRYLDGSLVLETIHRTATGAVRVVDLMPTLDDRADLIRIVTGVEGTVRMVHEWVVRTSYGKVVPWVHRVADDATHGCDEALVAIAGPDMLVLRGPRLPEAIDHRHRDEFEVNAGEELHFDLTWGQSYHPIPPGLAIQDRLDATLAESREWLQDNKYLGPYAGAVERSLLVLRALTNDETGGIVAAPTTSLPETLGGERNWDYRYCWLRDAAHTVEAVLDAGMPGKAMLWRDWLLRAVAGDPADLQIMYTVDGSRELPERELAHLPGYANSRPVRIGNGAVDQRQTDVLGEVMIALAKLRAAGLDETSDSWNLQRHLVNDLIEHWQEPDHGLWEMRGPAQHFTHSRLMVWAAFDRAIAAVEQHGLSGPVERWRAVRDEVRAAIEQTGYNSEIGCYTQHDATTEVDAALLLMPLVGYLDGRDERFVRTVEKIERDLLRDGLVLRYRTQAGFDGLAGDEHPFLLCNFWLVCAYAAMGRLDDAHALMRRLVGLANDVGLLAEEYDPHADALMGNFPQAFSHLGLVQAAVLLAQAS